MENCKVANADVSIPQFTPEDLFGGFEVIVARQKGDNVEVKIYTDATIKPKVLTKDGKLWIQPEAN